jgi:hypothetical protein
MYQVVFTGRLLKGADRATVEIELQRLFKATPRQVEWFLRGKSIVVKSCEDAATGRRYFDALTKAGLECELRSDQPHAAAMAPPSTEPAPPPAQLPIPEVAAPSARPAPPAAVVRAPTAETGQLPLVPMSVVSPAPISTAPPSEPETKPEAEPEAESETKPEAQAEPEAKRTAGPETESEAEPDAEPQITPATPEPAPAADASTGRAPGLGRVTQAITAQDRSPPWTAQAPSDVAAKSAARFPSATGRQWRRYLSVAFLVLGAALVGVLAYLVRLEWQVRHAPTAAAPIVPPVTQADEPAPAPAVAQTLETLIVGRWQCVEANSGRVVENEFSADGGYRSLAHGRPEAFQQIDQMDVLVEGRYWLEGNTVVLHVQYIPTREAFGSSSRVDDYLYWNIEKLDQDGMVWADTQMEEVRESCLRSQTLY